MIAGSTAIGPLAGLHRGAGRRTNDEGVMLDVDAFAVLEALPVGVFVAGSDGRCLFVNEKWRKMTGCTSEQALGDRWVELLHPDDRELVVDQWCEAATGEREFDLDFRYIAPAGTIRVVGAARPLHDSTGRRIGFVGSTVDITAHIQSEAELREQRELESRVRVSERLAAVGTLSASVAHEINNPLTYVQVQLVALQDGLAELEERSPAARMKELQTMAADAQHGVDRIAKVVRSLRTLTRTDEGRPSPRDLGRVVDGALQLLAGEVRRRARLVSRLESVPPVIGDDTRLGQVVVDLVLHAIQAFPRHQGQDGTIRVTLTTGAQGWVVVEVADDADE
ncbi:MAG TPA: PAS domain-containing protein, partial [Nannocystaceae bacterium]|nr:PAS domain-containing protein [Nannocystaceae bacterium]